MFDFQILWKYNVMHFIWYINPSIFTQFRSFIRKFKKGTVSMMCSKWRRRQSFQNRRTNNPNWASSSSHCIRLSLHIMTFLWDHVNNGLLCPQHSKFFLWITSQVGRNIREPHFFDNVVIFSHPYLDIIVRLFKMLHNVDKGSQF